MKVRLSLYAMQREYDDLLKWPAKASLAIGLLHQQGEMDQEITSRKQHTNLMTHTVLFPLFHLRYDSLK